MSSGPRPAAQPRLHPGLRLRIAATIALIVLAAVVAVGIAVHLLVVRTRVADARTSADDRLHAAMQIYRSTGLLSFDARVDDRSVPRVLTSSLRSDGARATLVRGGSIREIWAAGRVQDRVLSTETTVAVSNAAVRAVDRSLVLAGVATVVVASLVGLLSANQLARRLRVAARTARELAAGADPGSLRHAVGGRQDEVGDLADAVDAMTERLAARLSAEQRFTADVAHDLRTPVTGLVTAAALLDDSRPAELVRDRADTLRTLVEELLEVARLDRGTETAELEHVHLAEVVDRVVARGIASGEYAADQVVVHSDRDGSTLLTDPRRLERVLTNLVRNGLRHGEPPVVVSQSGTRVVVRDHGAGFDRALLEEGPQRFRHSRHRGDGNGLGLVIATGQTAVLGGTLVFDNDPGGGARVTMTLPGEDEDETDEHDLGLF